MQYRDALQSYSEIFVCQTLHTKPHVDRTTDLRRQAVKDEKIERQKDADGMKNRNVTGRWKFPSFTPAVLPQNRTNTGKGWYRKNTQICVFFLIATYITFPSKSQQLKSLRFWPVDWMECFEY
jgi:hypothetical protein